MHVLATHFLYAIQPGNTLGKKQLVLTVLEYLINTELSLAVMTLMPNFLQCFVMLLCSWKRRRRQQPCYQLDSVLGVHYHF